MSKRDFPEQRLVHLPLMHVVGLHKNRYPDLRGLVHIPNEGNRSRAENGILLGMGMRPGISDLLLLRARRGHAGLAMELKAPGKLPKKPDTYLDQWLFLREMAEENWLCCFCDDAAVGWSILQWYVTGGAALHELPGLQKHAVFVGVDN